MDLHFLPAVNAGLNAVAMTLLVVGRRFARQGRIDVHKRVMLSAFGVSTLFLVFYVLHKASKSFENTSFNVEGPAKVAYLLMLFSHIVLAAAVPVLAILVVRLGLREERERHRRLARIAWPIWMYVSVTGVLIYLLLYHLNPPIGS